MGGDTIMTYSLQKLVKSISDLANSEKKYKSNGQDPKDIFNDLYLPAIKCCNQFVHDNKVISIKNVKDGDEVRFLNHYHTILNDDINVSHKKGKIKRVKYDEDHEEIFVKMDSHFDQLNDWDNSLIFNFPDDEDAYGSVEVKLIRRNDGI